LNKIRPSVAIVANTTWNIYNFRLNVIQKLYEEGYEVYVIAPVDKYIHYTKQFPGIVHIPLNYLKRDSINPFNDLRLTLELIRIYKKIKPDLVLHYTVKPNIYGGVAAWFNGLPSLAVVTGLGYAFIHNGYIQRITKILYRLTSHTHEKVIFENTDDRLLFLKEGLIGEKQGISIKGCGVDSKFFSPYPNGIVKDRTTFTFIGRLLYDKGIQEFIDAARILKEKYDNVAFWLVGEIDDKNPATIRKEDLMSWVKEGIVTYHGATNNVKKYIAASDCIVLPSYREAIARSITEGMAMEKPVITTDTPGCREAVEDGRNGFLVPVKDALALSASMEVFHHLDVDQRHEMGVLGRQKVVEEFDDQLISQQIYQVIQRTLAEKRVDLKVPAQSNK